MWMAAFHLRIPNLLHPRIPIFISLDPNLYHCFTNRVSRITSRCINCEVDAIKTGRVFVFFCGRPEVFKTFALGGILDLQMFVGLQGPYLDKSFTY